MLHIGSVPIRILLVTSCNVGAKTIQKYCMKFIYFKTFTTYTACSYEYAAFLNRLGFQSLKIEFLHF